MTDEHSTTVQLRPVDCDAILAALEAALNAGLNFGPGLHTRNVEEAGRRIEAVADLARRGISASTGVREDESRVVRADEAELVKALRQQIDSYADGTNGTPKPVAAWLRALADKIDPDCLDDLFVDALTPDEPRTLEPAPPTLKGEDE